jgi:glycosyltransferase involved in cell wall biosynthesis
MKILMLTNFYPPIVGGTGKHVQSVSWELVKRDYEVIVCTTAQQNLPQYEEEHGVKIIRIRGLFQRIPFLFKDPARRHHPPSYDWAIGRRLKQIVEEHRPDVVNAHGWMAYSILPWIKDYGIPLVLSLMDCEFICPKQSLVSDGEGLCERPFTSDCIVCGKESYGLLKSIATYRGIKSGKKRLQSVDKFIAISSFTKQINTEFLNLKDEDVTVIPCFYDPSVDKQAISMQNIEGLPDDFILFVGALSPHKGIEVALEAYRKLDTQAKLVLIGSTHPKYRYQTGNGVVVFENAPRDVVMSAMSRCLFAVFPSIWAEGFGLVALEAMSHKKAVIASNIGGFKDTVVNGETGLLVTPGDAEKLSEAIAHLLENPQETSEMGLKGYERFTTNFTPQAIIPKIIEVYEKLYSA